MSNPLALIIEDERDLATIFAEALQIARFDTEWVADGLVALERVTQIVPYVIVLDLHLPNVSGQTILRQIRGDKRLDETKVVITTADALMADNLYEDVDLILLKPISFSQLRNLAIRLHPDSAK